VLARCVSEHVTDESKLATMVSLYRTLRSIKRVGIGEWWRQLQVLSVRVVTESTFNSDRGQYIGDAKSGMLVGKDQCVFPSS
jgi:hypothetical protein